MQSCDFLFLLIRSMCLLERLGTHTLRGAGYLGHSQENARSGAFVPHRPGRAWLADHFLASH